MGGDDTCRTIVEGAAGHGPAGLGPRHVADALHRLRRSAFLALVREERPVRALPEAERALCGAIRERMEELVLRPEKEPR